MGNVQEAACDLKVNKKVVYCPRSKLKTGLS